MTTILIIAIIVLWLLLGHAMRLIYAIAYAIARGGGQIPLGRRICYYLFAPVAAVLLMFDELFHRD